MSNEKNITVKGLSHEESRILLMLVDKAMEMNPGREADTLSAFHLHLTMDVARKAMELRVALAVKDMAKREKR